MTRSYRRHYLHAALVEIKGMSPFLLLVVLLALGVSLK